MKLMDKKIGLIFMLKKYVTALIKNMCVSLFLGNFQIVPYCLLLKNF